MEFNGYEQKPQSQPPSEESLTRKRLIDETAKELEKMSLWRLEVPEGREGMKLALGLIFDKIEAIENAGEYEVVGLIKQGIRDTYDQLYGIEFKGTKGSAEAGEFYGEIDEIMELIEERGKRFIEDKENYRRTQGDQRAA
jgi:hypothetical protein